jgi:predicted dithiol-disulfide oxidoreductase (DUF899 family)
MFAPDVEGWPSAGCSGCSMFVDQIGHLARGGDDVCRTYFTAGRCVEALGSVWTLLDLRHFGRQEDWEDSPAGYPQTPPYQWWHRHDDYP